MNPRIPAELVHCTDSTVLYSLRSPYIAKVRSTSQLTLRGSTTAKLVCHYPDTCIPRARINRTGSRAVRHERSSREHTHLKASLRRSQPRLSSPPRTSRGVWGPVSGTAEERNSVIVSFGKKKKNRKQKQDPGAKKSRNEEFNVCRR